MRLRRQGAVDGVGGDAADVRSAGDVPLVVLSEDGVTPADISLADELWLTALRLDPEGAL